MWDALVRLVDVVLHLDRHLTDLTEQYGVWMYAILFLIVFCETGLVITPFLPGDSLLFAAGALAALGSLDIWLLTLLLLAAAILGDTVNYHLGRYFGPRVLRGEKSRLFNRKHLDRTRDFFERYGAKAIILARFVPIVRTFAPFVAGVGQMNYRRFLIYNVTGAVLWVVGFVAAGYWFGQREFVKKNFPLVIIAIIVISVLPMVWEWWSARRRNAVDHSSSGSQNH